MNNINNLIINVQGNINIVSYNIHMKCVKQKQIYIKLWPTVRSLSMKNWITR